MKDKDKEVKNNNITGVRPALGQLGGILKIE